MTMAESESGKKCGSRYCVFPGCLVQNTDVYDEKLFQVTKRKDDFHSQWRKQIVDLVTLYREMDNARKQDVLDCKTTIWICERHFSPQDIELTKTRKIH